MVLIFFIVIALTLWIINILLKEEFIWYPTKINLPIFLFILIITVSLFRSSIFYLNLNDYLLFLAYFILYFLVINNVEDENEFDSFLKIFFITSFIVSMYTILHYYGLIPYLREFGPVVLPYWSKKLDFKLYCFDISYSILIFFVRTDKKNQNYLFYNIIN